LKQIYQSFKKGSLDVYDVPSPKIQKGMVIVKNMASVISIGTEGMVTSFGDKTIYQKVRSRPDLAKQVIDKMKIDGILPTLNAAMTRLDQPVALGYSCAGEIIAKSTEIKDVDVGDRVACAGGGYAAHAEQILVPRNLIAKIPEGVSEEFAAFTTIGSIAMQGVRLANRGLGDTVAVIGLGLVGLITVQLLKAAGCKIIAFDPKASQLEVAQKLGIKNVTADHDYFLNMCSKYTSGYGVDGVIITASTKSNEPVETAGEICRDKGIVVAVGAIGLNIPRKIYYEKELSFIISKSYGPGRYDKQYEEKGHDYPIGYVKWTENRNMQAFLSLLDVKAVDLDPIITHRFDINEADKAYELIKSPSDENLIGVIIQYPQKIKIDKKIILQPQKTNIFMSENNINIGFIGAGGFASNVIIPNLKKLTPVHLTGVCNTNPHTAHNKAQKFGFDYCTTDINEILKDDTINTLFITTRHNNHAELVLKALDFSKNIFVEKPLALKQEELKQISEKYISMGDNRPLVMVGFNRRFSPLVEKMKALLEERVNPMSIIITVNVGQIEKDHWTQDLEEGGGRIKGEACHFIDLMRFIVDKPITKWSAIKMGDDSLNDKVTISLAFEDGSFGSIHYFANGSKQYQKERVEVFNNGRILQLNNFKNLIGYGWPEFKKMKLRQQDKGHYKELQSFIDSINMQKSAPIPFDELLEVSRLTIDIAESI
jgi:predicted dehydrogenase